jgi:hypothetical protein
VRGRRRGGLDYAFAVPRFAVLSLQVFAALLVSVPTARADVFPLLVTPALFRGTPLALPGFDGVPLASERAPMLSNPCQVAPQDDEEMLARTQRRLYQTACRANLWFDGLFGPSGDVRAARSIYGRMEILGYYSEAEEWDQKVRFDARWEFPNLDRRLNAFLGREDEDDFVRDQSDGFALRPAFDLERQESWLAGLGYSLPGTSRQRVDFQVGARLRRNPEVFVQAKLRRNHYFGEKTALRFREVVFYQNRDGFGATSSLDIDRVLGKQTLFRFGTRLTRSESTDGADWRSAMVVYQNLPGDRAVAVEAFATGESAWEVPVREYGVRSVYRQRFLTEGVYAQAILGYTFPRETLADRREGSTNIGFGLEIQFGHYPKGVR